MPSQSRKKLTNFEKNILRENERNKELAVRYAKNTEERLKQISDKMDRWAGKQTKKAKKQY